MRFVLKTGAAAAFTAAFALIVAPSQAQAQELTLVGEHSVAVHSPELELREAPSRAGNLGALLPAGALVNEGDAPVQVVLWFEAADERRGFALFSGRRSIEAPRSAWPIATGEIQPGDRMSFDDLRIVDRHGGAIGEHRSGRVILAARSTAPLQVRGAAGPSRGGWAFAEMEEEEEVQAFPSDTFFPGDAFIPGDSFFPGDSFAPRR